MSKLFFSPTIFLLLALLLISSCASYKQMMEDRKNDLTLKLVQQGYRLEKIHHIVTCEALENCSVKPSRFRIGFMTKEQMNLDQGRIKAVNILEDLWKLLKSDPHLEKLFDLEPTIQGSFLQNFELVVISQKKDGVYFTPPDLSALIFSKGFFIYTVKDPDNDQARILLKESYEDAVAFRNAATKK